MKTREIALTSAAVAIGIILSFFIAEIVLRFYLFGFALHFQDNRVIDKKLFSDNKRKIFFVGASFTQGYPFPIHQSYPILLENKIGNQNIEITNFALRSTDMYGQINIIKQIMVLEPSVIVWGLATNDICVPRGQIQSLDKLKDYPSAPFPARRTSGWHYLKHIFFTLPHDCLFRAKMTFASTVKEVLVNSSYLYNFIRARVADYNCLQALRSRCNIANVADNSILGMLGYYKKNGYDFKHVFKALKYTKYLLRGKNIYLIVIFIPQEVDLNEKLFEDYLARLNAVPTEYDRTRPARSIGRFCSDNNISYINPADAMAAAVESGKKLFMKFDRHYNREGNAFIAEFLGENKLFLSLVLR